MTKVIANKGRFHPQTNIKSQGRHENHKTLMAVITDCRKMSPSERVLCAAALCNAPRNWSPWTLVEPRVPSYPARGPPPSGRKVGKGGLVLLEGFKVHTGAVTRHCVHWQLWMLLDFWQKCFPGRRR